MKCYVLPLATALLFIVSCSENTKTKKQEIKSDTTLPVESNKDSVIKNGHTTITISTNVGGLGKLMDLKMCKPAKVKYKYTFVDNSGGDQRLSVPGPSDHYLEALLYFDSATWKYIHDFSLSADYVSPKLDKQNFKFEWLDKEIINEINRSDSNYHGHPDMFFGDINGKLWYLDKKILYKQP